VQLSHCKLIKLEFAKLF